MSNENDQTGAPRQALLREEMLRKAAGQHSARAAESAALAGANAPHKNSHTPKNKTRFASGLFQQLDLLYSDMQNAYSETSGSAGLSCAECPQNCCHSYFRHHSFIEWAYLWRGLKDLPDERRNTLLERAKVYAAESELAQSNNTVPNSPCPILENGRCSLYSHRLMICRMHGTRNSLTMPDGKVQIFPGCFRYVEQTKDNPAPPTLDRTPFYSRLAALEMDFRQRKTLSGRVNLTIADMLLMGPPK